MLWDNQGNDRYSAEWLSQGSGNDSGRGLLIDEYGDDIYTAGMQGTQGCGVFDARRDESSIGILIDGSGRDTFKGNGKSNKVWTCGKIGGGIDAEGRMPAVWEEQWLKTDVSNAECGFRNAECVTRGKHSSLKTQMQSVIVPELEQPLITEDSWEQAAETLTGKGPAIIPALVQYLDIKDVLVSRALEETFKKIGKKNVADIHNLVQQQNMGSSKKAFLLCVLGDIANPQSKDLFLKLLKAKDTKVQAMTLRGLYKLKVSPPIKNAKRLAKSDNVDVRRYLALALQPCEDKGAVIPLLVKLQRDKDFNIRYAAAEAIKQ
jgi:hypothetical protein